VNRDEKAAVIEQVATQIRESEAVYAVDYRGLSVTQAVALRARLGEAGANLRVVKNTLTELAADQAGAEPLKAYLHGPTAFAFVSGDAALAAKVIATFRRENQLPEFKGGILNGDALTIDQIESIARLPTREVLQGQFVGVLASPITGLVRGLASLISGMASQLGQIRDQGLVTGGPGETPAAEAAPAASEAAEAPAASEAAEAPAVEEAPTADEAPAAEEAADASAAEEEPAAEAPSAEDAAVADEDTAPATEAEVSEAPPEAEEQASEGDAPEESTADPEQPDTDDPPADT